MDTKKTYILFEKKQIAEKPPMMIYTQADLMNVIREQINEQQSSNDGEDWNAVAAKKKQKPKMKTVYEFVAKVDSPAAVARIVRSAPLKKYALFSGILSTIDIQLPVLIDGVAADALSNEWAVAGEDLKGFDTSVFDEIDESLAD